VDYQEFMQQALLLAKDAAGHNDVPVGAVVVNQNGEVIGRGKNEREKNNDPLAHAELIAIRDAAYNLNSWRFDDATLVVAMCNVCWCYRPK
jgi:tRNA(adenine34) deaminase